MADDGTCYRCHLPLGSNAVECWWCRLCEMSRKESEEETPPPPEVE